MCKPQIWDLAFSKPTVCVVISHHFLWADNGDIIYHILYAKTMGVPLRSFVTWPFVKSPCFPGIRGYIPEDHQSSVTEPSLGCLKRPLQLLLSKHTEAAWNWNRHSWIDMTATQHCIKHCIYIYTIRLCWNMHRKPICRRYSFSQSFSRLENSCPVWLGESAMCFFGKYLLQSLVSFRCWMDVACDNDGFLLVHKNYEEMYPSRSKTS